MDTLECNSFWDHSLYLPHSLSMWPNQRSWRRLKVRALLMERPPVWRPGTYWFTSQEGIWGQAWLDPGGRGTLPHSFANHPDFTFSRTLWQCQSQSLQPCGSTRKKVFPVRAIFKDLRETVISLPFVQCRLGRRPHLLFCLWALCMEKSFFFYITGHIYKTHTFSVAWISLFKRCV